MKYLNALFLFAVLSSSSISIAQTVPASPALTVGSPASVPALAPDQVQIQAPKDMIGYADGKVHNLGQLLAMLVGLMGTLRVVSESLNRLALFTKSKSVSAAAIAVSTAVSSLAWVIGWFHLGAPSTIEKPASLPTFLVSKTDKTV